MPAADAPLALDEVLRCFACFPEAAAVLLAVSGGSDSIAMMRLAAAAASAGPFPRLAVATVDHGLRPGSRETAEAVLDAAAKLGLEARLLVWHGPKPGTAIQDRARAHRYALLAACAHDLGATHLATAHTLDDQAETVLLRMSRGSGLRGLAGMRAHVAHRGIVHLRPFLDISRGRLAASCRAGGWAFEDDPANADERFGRVRLRRLLPMLAAEGLDARRLATLARRLSEADLVVDAAARRAVAAAAVPGPTGGYGARGLLAAPPAVLVRALELILAPFAGDRHLRLERVERLAHALGASMGEGRPLRRTLAGALVAFDGVDRLVLAPEPPRLRGAAAVGGSLGKGKPTSYIGR